MSEPWNAARLESELRWLWLSAPREDSGDLAIRGVNESIACIAAEFARVERERDEARDDLRVAQHELRNATGLADVVQEWSAPDMFPIKDTAALGQDAMLVREVMRGQQADLAAAREEVARLRAYLRRLEWVEQGNNCSPSCPACDEHDLPHAQGCWLAEVLATGAAPAQPAEWPAECCGCICHVCREDHHAGAHSEECHRRMVEAMARMSEPALARVWDNESDAAVWDEPAEEGHDE